MSKLLNKVASVIPGEYTCQVRFKDNILVTVITDGHGTIDVPSKVAQLPSGDPAEAPEGYLALAEKLSLEALARRAARQNRPPKGRAMSGRGVTS